MVYINNTPIVGGIFPNSEKYYKPVKDNYLNNWSNIHETEQDIKLVFEDNGDLFDALVYKKYLDDKGFKKIVLKVDFLPYGQMDRPLEDKIFTFKYFAQLINDANFLRVEFLDPHSRVMEMGIERAKVTYPNFWGYQADEYDLYFYPDTGAASKYSEIFKNLPYRYGNKKRDLTTGEVIKYEVVAEPAEIQGKTILIRDDICMGGRTFKEAAKALNELGAKRVDLFITHLMPIAKEFYGTREKYGITNFYTCNTLNFNWVKSREEIMHL